MRMHVLFCTDGSVSAREAEGLLAAVADPRQVEITVAAVMPTWFGSSQSLPEEVERLWVPLIEEAAVRLTAAGFAVRGMLINGRPGLRINKEAVAGDYDLTVVGSGGKDWLGNLLIGSVSSRVLHGAPSSVLVVHRGPEDVDGSLTLLVGVDGSPDSERAVQDLIGFAATSKCRIVVAAIASSPPPAYLPVPGSEMVPRVAAEEGEVRRTSLARARRNAQRAADRLEAAGFEIAIVVEEGRPVNGLLDLVEKESADLVVLGARGMGRVGRAIFGSVSDQVTRLAPATLVARPRRAVVPPPAQVSEVRAGEIMTAPAVVVGADATLQEVAETMLERGLGCVPVVEDGKLVGIITESDFAGRKRRFPFTSVMAPYLFGDWMPNQGIEEIYRAARTKKAGEIMTPDPFTAREDEPVTDVIHRMVERDVHRLPIVRGRTVVGVVTRHDLLGLMAQIC